MIRYAPPPWIEHIKDATERQLAMTRFLVKIAACYASEAGSVDVLCKRAGISPNTANKPQLTAETCLKIENCVGREYMPREVLRPDLFILPHE